jgi:Cys-tRNA(Pro) deacylase
MTAREKLTKTRAVRVLTEKGVAFTLYRYKYEEHGGTEVAARALGVDEHMVVKTLVFEDDKGEPLLLLMHGDRQVSTKNLARTLKVKTVRACDPKVAHKHTGYVVGGISPFGTRGHLRVYIERTILDLPRLVINAGKRGLLAEMSPRDLSNLLNATPVDVAV